MEAMPTSGAGGPAGAMEPGEQKIMGCRDVVDMMQCELLAGGWGKTHLLDGPGPIF